MTGAGGCAFAHGRSGADDLLADACGLLVDLDGTLVDSTVPVHRAWTAFAARHRLDPAEVIRLAQGRPAGDTVRRLIPPFSDPVTESAVVDHAELRDTTGVQALPGAAALLAGTTPLAIVTSCSRALATVRLAAAGLPMPPVLVSCDDVVSGKPDPACFRLGARLLRRPDRSVRGAGGCARGRVRRPGGRCARDRPPDHASRCRARRGLRDRR
jgi:beta-phosphoglucomutase-like phosphatase (HAD superfamily)